MIQSDVVHGKSSPDYRKRVSHALSSSYLRYYCGGPTPVLTRPNEGKMWAMIAPRHFDYHISFGLIAEKNTEKSQSEG